MLLPITYAGNDLKRCHEGDDQWIAQLNHMFR